MPNLSRKKIWHLGLSLDGIFKAIDDLISVQSDIVFVYFALTLEDFDKGLVPSPLLQPTRITLDQLTKQFPNRHQDELASAMEQLRHLEPTLCVPQIGSLAVSDANYQIVEIVRKAFHGGSRPMAPEWWIRAGQWAFWEFDHLCRIYSCRIAHAVLSANDVGEKELARTVGLRAAEIAISNETIKPVSLPLHELLVSSHGAEGDEKLTSILSTETKCHTLARVLDMLEETNVLSVSVSPGISPEYNDKQQIRESLGRWIHQTVITISGD